ncbi:ribonucleotide reductase subunit 2 [Falconid herpesvirus 1]|uniref:ribonucleoside-diphosphate reductase n=2 Tax=Columbid alphaherpesvirus 1 TaxID=93386 RepID=A0A068EVZ1_9ALPH|nr:ribonucleotide reductase subunit 2 [Falconid herpesvirus 1]YP_009352948.1 ribonucleotide reductase subunit 2 [Columbid alphaherpesvirus 1]AID52744.1 ribonucleotide reductase subunit 2 [Falconid herpesvirus 1]ARD71365.1 ribonucleotide reductase subunit 2 [Columbid alphaherpesvirus 1]
MPSACDDLPMSTVEMSVEHPSAVERTPKPAAARPSSSSTASSSDADMEESAYAAETARREDFDDSSASTDSIDIEAMDSTDSDPATDDIVPEHYFYTPQCPDINHLRSLSILNRWLETEFVISDDLKDVCRLTEEELDFYKFIFVFLSAADDLVNLNLGDLQSLFDQKDIHHYYIEQESIETIHSRSYSIIQLMLFQNDAAARAEYVRRCIKDPAITAKISWLDARVAECDSIAEKYILMILIEGIFFSSSFAAIAYLRVNSMFVVTCQINTLISRDEAVHTNASCCIYNNYLKNHPKPSPRRIHQLFKEAVEIECSFLRCRAPKNSKILNLDAIYGYVRYTADRLLAEIKMPTIYDEPRPAVDFPMALMFAENNTNFFERRSTAYSGSVMNDL